MFVHTWANYDFYCFILQEQQPSEEIHYKPSKTYLSKSESAPWGRGDDSMSLFLVPWLTNLSHVCEHFQVSNPPGEW